MQRQEKNRDKAERRKTRKDDRSQRPDPAAPGEDPDIAHIVWGPQPTDDEKDASVGAASGKGAASGSQNSRKGGDAISSKDNIGASKQ
jgi:hypothetical protein